MFNEEVFQLSTRLRKLTRGNAIDSTIFRVAVTRRANLQSIFEMLSNAMSGVGMLKSKLNDATGEGKNVETLFTAERIIKPCEWDRFSSKFKRVSAPSRSNQFFEKAFPFMSRMFLRSRRMSGRSYTDDGSIGSGIGARTIRVGI